MFRKFIMTLQLAMTICSARIVRRDLSPHRCADFTKGQAGGVGDIQGSEVYPTFQPRI